MGYVGIRQFKEQLSKYVRDVRKGDVVVITDHGKPVARLVNIGVSDDNPSLASLAAEGLIVLPTRKLSPAHKPLMPAGRGKSLSQAVIEDRR